MQQLFKKTDKNYITTLPRYTYKGKIVVVQSESEAERACGGTEQVAHCGHRHGNASCLSPRRTL